MATRYRPNQAQWFLLASVAVTLLLYFVPYGRLVAYPLLLLSTLAHELGHGLAAIAVGGRFEALEMMRDGSGAAHWSAPDAAGWRRALVAAGGLVGPAVGAAIGFAAARARSRSKPLLLGAIATLVLVTVLFVRNLFGLLFVSAVVVGLALLVRFATPDGLQLAVIFLSVQLALAVFSRADYLFTPTAGASGQPSDVQLIANALFLPYWFWGAICGGLSLLILAIGLRGSLGLRRSRSA
jgi:hypothetical protein